MLDRESSIEQGMEILPLRECERLLDRGGVGILALSGETAPVLRPVNFTRSEGWLWLLTGEGQIRAAAERGDAVSFLICELERFEHTGWSVVVTGGLEACRDDVAVPELRLRPWVRADKDNLVRIAVDEITGRRVAPPGGAS